MLNHLLRVLAGMLLGLRYRVVVRGLEEVRARGTRKILFLPTHPALIDPILAVLVLHRHFAVRPIADVDGGMDDNPVFSWLAHRFGVYFMPLVIKHGAQAKQAVAAVMARAMADLRAGNNLLMYPAGHLLRTNTEDLGANSGVEAVLRDVPDVRVVLVRIRGLWGSAFSCAGTKGADPPIPPILRKGLRSILANGIFFTPRRTVTFEFHEPADLPRDADRDTLNRYIERFYNAEPLPRNTYVPYTLWEGGGTRELPEPVRAQRHGDPADVPPAIRETVLARLRELSGMTTIPDEAELARDLGLDSLVRSELAVWLEQEFATPIGEGDTLQTVADALLAAAGEAPSEGEAALQPVPGSWFTERRPRRLTIPDGHSVGEVFLRRAAEEPDTVIVADQTSGARTYRNLITGIYALLPSIRRLPGDAVGIMLPASVAACVAYLATLFAGKTPVMINWTVGARNLRHGLELTGVRHVLTAQRLISRLDTSGVDLTGIRECFLPLETLAAGLSPLAKLRAALAARLSWVALRRVRISPTAAILFTSGSESLPKAVPLTHENVLANLRDVTGIIRTDTADRLLGMLPPFHSFGLTGNMLFALCAGMRTAFHPNPTEGAQLARLIEAYRVTTVIGTPTFLHGIARGAEPGHLASLRLAVTGAEECPPRVYQTLADRCPHAVVLEGYGITECSPIVSLNDESHPQPGTIGRLLPSLHAALVDVETGAPAAPGATGMLLLRGPSIFTGYLGDAPSPFVEFAGEQWYRTGDLVSRDDDGVYTFRGRLKRFVKIGGEMVSLPAIESVLNGLADASSDDGPALAVLATEDADRPEIILVTILPIDREAANRRLRDAGLSGLHNIRRVITVAEIPVLGTGKTDYRALQRLLAENLPDDART